MYSMLPSGSPPRPQSSVDSGQDECPVWQAAKLWCLKWVSPEAVGSLSMRRPRLLKKAAIGGNE